MSACPTCGRSLPGTGKAPSTSAIFTWAAQLRQHMLQEYRVVQEAEYQAAEEATGGRMLTRKAEAAGRDSWVVFHSGPTTLRACASEELLEHLRTYPRTTRTEYERAWLASYLGGEQ